MSSQVTDPLAGVRARIDSIDTELLRLLNQRAECAMEVARIKRQEDADAHFYRPEREAQVLRRVKEQNPGPLAGESLAFLFREIMSACLALEQPLKIAYLGPEGTFTQAAALKHFGHQIKTHPVTSIADVFREVESGTCHYGVVPVENSTEGVITHTLDTFIGSPLLVSGEVMLPIHHHLLGLGVTDASPSPQPPEPVEGSTGRGGDGIHRHALAAIQQVYSHQQSLAQCRAWLDRNLPHAERLPVASNAEAARLAAEAGPAAAAIAPEAAASIYGLHIMQSNIEDEPGNTTRFLVIGRESVPPSGDDKTCLLLSTRNEAGALHRLLAPLAEHGISMSRIESRPSRRGVWDYVFFIDVLGHQQEPALAKALAELKTQAAFLRVLGSFPNAVL